MKFLKPKEYNAIHFDVILPSNSDKKVYSVFIVVINPLKLQIFQGN